jgi:tripartite-type tricarboxylate transporter receptor subunit TctC
MQMQSLVWRTILMGCLPLLLLNFGRANAQGYPSRPIRLIVPFPPGGANDILARILGQKLSETLGENVIVDNRAGASGIIGTELVAKAAPDGYTLLMTPNTIAIQPSLYEKLPFDAAKDFAPVSLVALVPNILIVTKSLPVSSVKELVALAKRHPGEVHFGSAGIGGSVHLAAELFKSMANVDIVHVPYKGGGPALIDLIGGHIEMLFPDALASSPHLKTGKVKPLAVTSSKRLSALPELPTIAESGVPGYDSVGWYGVVAPANTPPQVVQSLSAAIANALRSADIKAKLSAQAAEPVGGTPAEFGAHIATEARKWAKVIKAAGIRAE